MSLVAFAMRVSTVRAIQEAVPPSFRVFDSPVDPIDLLDKKNPQPIIAVYTGSVGTKIDGREILAGASRVALAIQIFLPERFVFAYAGESQEQKIEIDCRRQGAETALDVIWRKIALNLNSTNGPWGEMWREIVLATPSIDNSSYVIMREGVKLTAREIVIECEPIHEPVPGKGAYLAWKKFLSMVLADTGADGLHNLGDWVASEIHQRDLSAGESDAAYLGLSRYVAVGVEVIQEVKDRSVLVDQENIEPSPINAVVDQIADPDDKPSAVLP